MSGSARSKNVMGEPITDLERSVLSRMVRELRELRKADNTSIATDVADLERLLQQYWWLMSHRDTVGAVAQRAEVDHFSVAEVLSVAHRRLIDRLHCVAEAIEDNDTPTQKMQRPPNRA